MPENMNQSIRFIMRQTNYSIQYPKLFRLIGTLEAVYLTNLVNWFLILEEKDQLTEDGFFYHEQERIYHETGISLKAQGRVLSELVKLNLVKVERKGIPSKYYYKPNLENIEKLLLFEEHSVKKQTKKRQKIKLASGKNFQNNQQGYQLGPKVPTSEDHLAAIQNGNTPLSEGGVKGFCAPKVIGNSNSVRNKLLSLPNGNSITYNSHGMAEKPASQPTSLSVREQLAKNGHKINGTKKKNNEQPATPIPRKLIPIVNLWEALGLALNRKSKVFPKDINYLSRLTEGSAFKGTKHQDIDRPFTIDEISIAIKRFAMKATSSDYQPTDVRLKRKLQLMSPSSFVYNPYTQNSNFLLSLEHKPILVADSITPTVTNNPRLVSKLVKLYIDMTGRNNDFTQYEKNMMTNVANQLTEFHSQEYNPSCSYQGESLHDFATIFMEAIAGRFDITKISVNLLNKDFIFREFLPAYLTREGLWDRDDETNEDD